MRTRDDDRGLSALSFRRDDVDDTVDFLNHAHELEQLCDRDLVKIDADRAVDFGFGGVQSPHGIPIRSVIDRCGTFDRLIRDGRGTDDAHPERQPKEEGDRSPARSSSMGPVQGFVLADLGLIPALTPTSSVRWVERSIDAGRPPQEARTTSAVKPFFGMDGAELKDCNRRAGSEAWIHGRTEEDSGVDQVDFLINLTHRHGRSMVWEERS